MHMLMLVTTASLVLMTGLANAADPAGRSLPRIRVAPGGRSFVTAEGKPFHPMGVNYYRPGTGWAPQLWKKFDAEVIFAYDLRNEPAVSWDNPTMRRKWNGWLQKQYGSADKAAKAWGVAPGTIRWGQQPPPAAKDAPGDRQLLDYQHFREEVADEWTRRQAAAIKASDPQALVTVGLIQWSVPALLPGVRHYSGFRPQRQAKLLDFMEVHFYPLESGFYEYAGEESRRRNLAYLESVVREVAAPGKPVVLAEFGWYGGGKLTIDQGRHPAASQEQQARWCREVIQTTQGLATGWLNWGFYDQPEARDVSQLTGLLTSDGKPKAWAREFQALAGSLSGRMLCRLPRSARVPRSTGTVA